jgi:hypothetical protein
VRGDARCETEVPPLRPVGDSPSGGDSGAHRVATFYDPDTTPAPPRDADAPAGRRGAGGADREAAPDGGRGS